MTLSPDSKRLTIQPAEHLIAGSWYSLYVMITDTVGNALITPGTGGFFAFSFQVATGSLTEELRPEPLTVIHANPPAGADETAVLSDPRGWPFDGATEVSPQAVVVVTWDGPLEAASRLRLRTVAGEPVAFRTAVRAEDGRAAATLTPHQILEPGAGYRVTAMDDEGGEVEISTFVTKAEF